MDTAADDMLREVGDFGPSQYVMLSAFCVINILAAMHYFSSSIILETPEHW